MVVREAFIACLSRLTERDYVAKSGIFLRRLSMSQERDCHGNAGKQTYQSVELSDADFIRVHHAELSPGYQVQTQLPVKAQKQDIVTRLCRAYVYVKDHSHQRQ